MEKLNKLSKIFYIIITSGYTLCLAYIGARFNLIIGIGALSVFITIYLVAVRDKYYKDKTRFYLKNLTEYLFYNFIFFLFFIVPFKLLDSSFYNVKLILFVFLVFGVSFNTYSITKVKFLELKKMQ